MSFKFLDNYNFIPFAHRGGSYDFCENTLDAFNNSINLGYRHIETDVRHTKDNKLIIFHDPDLKRILGLDAKIENLNYEEIKNIKIFETHTIPLLDEALSSWPDINFNIEPKSLESAYLLKDKLKSMKNIDRICIGSFSNTKIDILRNEFKDNLCSSMTKSETILFFLNRFFSIYDNSIPCLQIPMTYMGFRIVTSDLVEHVHSLGKKIHVWTINDENQMIDLININVDGIMTDKPTTLKKVLQKKSLWN